VGKKGDNEGNPTRKGGKEEEVKNLRIIEMKKRNEEENFRKKKGDFYP